nr:MAG TPA: hypothetical protein [Bacteriophage sp.]
MMLCSGILLKASCCYVAVVNSQSPRPRRLFFYIITVRICRICKVFRLCSAKK